MRKLTYLAPIALAITLTGCGEADGEEAGTTSDEALETVEAPDGQKWSDTVTVNEAGRLCDGQSGCADQAGGVHVDNLRRLRTIW